MDLTKTKFLAIISSSINPNNFHLRLYSKSDEFCAFQEKLQIVAPVLLILTTIEAGKKCIIKCVKDFQWHRGTIIGITDNGFTVQFIDTGHIQYYTNETTMKEYMESFNDFSDFAIPCSLPVKPFESVEWPEEACNEIADLNNVIVHAEFMGQDMNNRYIVNLETGPIDIILEDVTNRHIVHTESGPVNVAEELISTNLAELESTKIKENFKMDNLFRRHLCYIIHMNSFDDFYIRLDAHKLDINNMNYVLRNANNFPQFFFEELNEAEIYAALFNGDNCYYRVKFMEKLNEEFILVRSVDYGKEFHTSSIRRLPEKIRNFKPLALRCAFNRSSDLTDQQINKFVGVFTASTDQIFSIEVVNEKEDIKIVNLFKNNEKI